MAIPQKGYDLILNWFNDNHISQACPSCGEEFENKSCELSFIESPSRANVTGHAIINSVAITCDNCGLIRLYDADKMGFKVTHKTR
jgi:predicted nucleic-acid-binding Zn-ribbon protein